ncbi:MAG: class B sortase [Lachnospiraceae bacterium]|nr:class B sortase [Lachnospiraceae bacterium]MCI9680568.1 class B sortase [Lachnospiraceae bacterium]
MAKKGNEHTGWKKIQKSRFFFGGLLAVSLIFTLAYYIRQERAEAMYRELKLGQDEAAVLGGISQAALQPQALEEEPEPAMSGETVEAETPPHLENTIDFTKLWERNEDIYAWITIPGTQVDYPVLQHPADDAYYLNHTLEGMSGLPGSIYSEKVHPKDFSAVQTVLYGHNMKNGTMFGSLHEYEDAAFFKEYPYVYIHLPERTLVYRIFAAVQFSNAYLPIYRNYEEEAGFTAYVEELKSAPGQADREIKVPYGSRLLTLSTCIGNDADHRFLVAAVQVEEYERK